MLAPTFRPARGGVADVANQRAGRPGATMTRAHPTARSYENSKHGVPADIPVSARRRLSPGPAARVDLTALEHKKLTSHNINAPLTVHHPKGGFEGARQKEPEALLVNGGPSLNGG